MTTPDSTRPPDAFVTTQWTRMLAARGESPEARAALSDLCEAYYAPVLACIRRGRDEDSARDLAQEFFARLLSGRGFDHAEKGRGRFRYFLLGALKHFLADQYDRTRAAKRGGGQTPLSLDVRTASDTESSVQIADPAVVPDAFFDRQWALAVLGRGLAALATEQREAGKAGQFAAIKPWLTGGEGDCSQAQLALRLGISEGALKVSIHRLRRRFRELVKAEIARTIGPEEDAQVELNYLIEAVSRTV